MLHIILHQHVVYDICLAASAGRAKKKSVRLFPVGPLAMTPAAPPPSHELSPTMSLPVVTLIRVWFFTISTRRNINLGGREGGFKNVAWNIGDGMSGMNNSCFVSNHYSELGYRHDLVGFLHIPRYIHAKGLYYVHVQCIDPKDTFFCPGGMRSRKDKEAQNIFLYCGFPEINQPRQLGPLAETIRPPSRTIRPPSRTIRPLFGQFGL